MPEFTAVTVALLALLLVAGMILGWVLRGDRSAKEKIAINAGWQQQIESQQSEHDRLAKQNKSLMEQISQYQASMKDSTLRAKELSESLKEAFQRRDDVQRQLKEVRSNLEVAVAERERMQGELRSKVARDSAIEQAMQQRDAKIQKLTADLATWRSRVPPLVDRYRVRDEEARELENELSAARADLAEAQVALTEARDALDQARTELHEARTELDLARADRDATQSELDSTRVRIADLEDVINSENTRINPVDAETLPKGLDASNEPHDETAENPVSGLRDQIDDDAVPLSAWLREDGDLDHSPIDTPDDDGPWARVAASPATGENNVGPDDYRADGAIPPGTGHADSAVNSAPLNTEPAEASPPYVMTSGNHASGVDDKDDLRQIKGVGPSIEKTLHDLGFFRYAQIAAMTEFDIERVARQLKGFRSRIYREDWIGQARMLQQQKHNNPS
ncbi:MAG: hypothetical protein L0Y45_03250 [Woeseiaceae bacterium]|nr:hypothetical protein [Woeseiaceae bacterium]